MQISVIKSRSSVSFYLNKSSSDSLLALNTPKEFYKVVIHKMRLCYIVFNIRMLIFIYDFVYMRIQIYINMWYTNMNTTCISLTNILNGIWSALSTPMEESKTIFLGISPDSAIDCNIVSTVLTHAVWGSLPPSHFLLGNAVVPTDIIT